MTSQESFKRRVRDRMARTGERYTAARKVLLDQSSASPRESDRVWVSPPEMSEEKMRARTGRGHNEWADIIEAWDGDATDHTAVAKYLHENFDELDGWWAQGVTVSYERITGQRLPFQRADGSFACSKSRTVSIDAGHQHVRASVDLARQRDRVTPRWSQARTPGFGEVASVPKQ